jgi:hypothetical protein
LTLCGLKPCNGRVKRLDEPVPTIAIEPYAVICTAMKCPAEMLASLHHTVGSQAPPREIHA